MNNKTDLDQLRKELKELKPNTPLFKLLREELTKLELWATDDLFIKWLIDRVPKMQRWQPIYKNLKTMLTKMEYWRNKPRANPRKGYALGFGKWKEKMRSK